MSVQNTNRFYTLNVLLFILLTIVGAGGYYWWSERMQNDQPASPDKVAKADSTSQKEHWSAAEISSNPKGYLQWAKQRAYEARDRIEDRLRALQDRINDANLRIVSTGLKRMKQEEAMNKLKKTIKRSDETNDWPVLFDGRLCEKADLNKRLQKIRRQWQAHKQEIQQLGDLKIQLRDARTKLLTQRESVDDLITALKQEMAAISKQQSEEQILEIKDSVEALSTTIGTGSKEMRINRIDNLLNSSKDTLQNND
jgi:chromosome segregation ATPase